MALIPYTAVVSMMIPQMMMESEDGKWIPNELIIRFVKASPQMAVLRPNQPNRERVNSTLATYFDPCFPKQDCRVTQAGTLRSLP